jgi:hypothetical protein
MAQVARRKPVAAPSTRPTAGTVGRKPIVSGGGTTKPGSPVLTLPTELSIPAKSLSEVHWCIYGETKIGKTSLCSMFPGACFMFFEPGGKGLELFKRYPANWREFVGYVDLLEKDTRFKTVVIDTADKAYDFCFEHVCKREVMRYPSEKEWGEGWRLIRTEFSGQMERLARNKSVIFISHAEDREFADGRKLVPSMGTQPRTFIGGFVDVIAYYGYHGDDRYLTIRGSERIDAGNRLKRRFRTKDGKGKVHAVPMFDPNKPDYDEEDAYRALLAAFNNEQIGSGEPEELPTLSERPKIRQRRPR